MKKNIFFLIMVAVLSVAGARVVSADDHDARGLSLEAAIASGECDEGDVPCLEALMQASDEDSKSDDGSSDDKSSRDDDSKSDDASSDDGSSDDDSKPDDSSSDDKSSRDDDSKSDDGSSDDSKSDDDSSDDKSSEDDDSSSDDETPLPGVSISDGQGTEFNNITTVPVVLTVSLSAAATQPAMVSWATADGTAMAGSDYVAASGVIEFAVGQQDANLTVFVIGDDVPEVQESFFVRLTMPVGATLLDSEGVVTVLDDDDTDE